MPVPSIFAGLADVFAGALGQAVTLTLHGGAVREVQAIFRQPSVEGIEIAMQEPQIALRAVDASGLADDDLVEIDGERFRVRTTLPDGRGMVDVMLERDYS